MNLQKTQPVGRMILINMLQGSLNTEESKCNIDEDITRWVQTAFYTFAFRRTFRTVSLGGTKLMLKNDCFHVSNVLAGCPNFGSAKCSLQG